MRLLNAKKKKRNPDLYDRMHFVGFLQAWELIQKKNSEI